MANIVSRYRKEIRVALLLLLAYGLCAFANAFTSVWFVLWLLFAWAAVK